MTYYAIRVEFQVRGSPHIHSFLWVLNAPVLTEKTVAEYTRFVDSVVKVYVPDINENPELFRFGSIKILDAGIILDVISQNAQLLLYH